MFTLCWKLHFILWTSPQSHSTISEDHCFTPFCHVFRDTFLIKMSEAHAWCCALTHADYSWLWHLFYYKIRCSCIMLCFYRSMQSMAGWENLSEICNENLCSEKSYRINHLYILGKMINYIWNGERGSLLVIKVWNYPIDSMNLDSYTKFF
jgi:hypothetical protein